MTSIQRQISVRLKALRRSRGLTLDQLANETGFTKSYLSKIENLKKVPPIGSLAQICRALKVELAALFQTQGEEETPSDKVCVVRAQERQPAVRGGTTFGYDYENLAHRIAHKHMEPFLFTFPTSISEEVYFQHVGEEFVFVISGRVRFLVEGREWTLSPGDSLSFDSALLHRGEAMGSEAKALVVIYCPEPLAEAELADLAGDPAGSLRRGGLHAMSSLAALRTRLSHPRKS